MGNLFVEVAPGTTGASRSGDMTIDHVLAEATP